MDWEQFLTMVPVLSLIVALVVLIYNLDKDRKTTLAQQKDESAKNAEWRVRLEDKVDTALCSIDEIKESQKDLISGQNEHEKRLIVLEQRPVIKKAAPRKTKIVQEG